MDTSEGSCMKTGGAGRYKIQKMSLVEDVDALKNKPY